MDLPPCQRETSIGGVVAAEALSRTLETYLAGSRNAIVLEDGATLFDLNCAKYSLSGEYGECLLHLWSEERNTVRRVLEAEEKKGTPQLTVQRMGQPRPSKLEICRNRDPRTTSSRKAARAAYQRQLQRMLERTLPEFRMIHITTGANLEQSFGPVYAQGPLRRGQGAFAVFGVNAQEAQSPIDASLTFAILWLDLCRKTRLQQTSRRGPEALRPRRHCRLGSFTDGPPQPIGRQVAALRRQRNGRHSRRTRLP